MMPPEQAVAVASSHVYRKSSFCAHDACVEVALGESEVRVRDGKDRRLPILRFSGVAWEAFVAGVASGEFERGV
jgi:hypothetical protein